MEKLTDGLQQITVTHCERMGAEGKVLTGWLQRRLAACETKGLTFVTETGEAGRLGVVFGYEEQRRYFRCQGNLQTGHAQLECDFGAGESKLLASVSILTPENALSEAMFF